MGGILAEIALVPVLFGVGYLVTEISLPEWASFFSYNAAMFLVLLLVGLLAAPKAGFNVILNGGLIGAVAAIVVLPLFFAFPPPNPIHEAINEVLKVIGGAAGGAIAGWRRSEGVVSAATEVQERH